jgi:hypothetical protein
MALHRMRFLRAVVIARVRRVVCDRRDRVGT